MIRRMGLYAAAGIISAYLLYRNIWVSAAAMVIFSGYAFLSRKNSKTEVIRKVRERFLDFLMCLEPLLKSSETFSRAFTEAAADYRRFHGKDKLSKYLAAASNDFHLNKPTHEILISLAEKTEIEEARTFAQSISICESTGGNAVEITGRTTGLLIWKMRILCDINTMLSGRKFEQKVITVMPFLLLTLFFFTQESYLEPLYSCPEGRMVMSVAAALFLGQWIIGRRLMEIRV